MLYSANPKTGEKTELLSGALKRLENILRKKGNFPEKTSYNIRGQDLSKYLVVTIPTSAGSQVKTIAEFIRSFENCLEVQIAENKLFVKIRPAGFPLLATLFTEDAPRENFEPQDYRAQFEKLDRLLKNRPKRPHEHFQITINSGGTIGMINRVGIFKHDKIVMDSLKEDLCKVDQGLQFGLPKGASTLHVMLKSVSLSQ